MWPFPVARAGSGCACCDAWCNEVGLRAYFFQNNRLNFRFDSSAKQENGMGYFSTGFRRQPHLHIKARRGMHSQANSHSQEHRRY